MKAIVTSERVFEAADQLRATGEEPTIITVQNRIGGGSYTTIKRYLDEWHTARQAAQQQRADLPDSLAERALSLAQALWQEATDRALKEAAQARGEAQRQVTEARAALTQAEAAIARLEAEGEAQAQQIGEQQHQLTRMAEDLTQLRSQAQVAEARADEQAQRVRDLTRELDLAHQQITQLSEEAVQARGAAIEQARLEGELRALKAQLQERDALIERLVTKPAARRAKSTE